MEKKEENSQLNVETKRNDERNFHSSSIFFVRVRKTLGVILSVLFIGRNSTTLFSRRDI